LAENAMDLSEMPIVGKIARMLRWSGPGGFGHEEGGKREAASQK